MQRYSDIILAIYGSKYKNYFENIASRFISHIENGASKTELCKIMEMHCSDKSTMHNYTMMYTLMFDDIRSEVRHLLEVGIGTNNVDVPSNMGPAGVPGASLRGWRAYFPEALIIGADVDARILFEEDRIKTFKVDQTDPASIKSMWNSVGFDKLDIIIDDGLHTFKANETLFNNSVEKLNGGGFYIIEDILEFLGDMDSFHNLLKHHEAMLVRLPHAHKQGENTIAIVRGL